MDIHFNCKRYGGDVKSPSFSASNEASFKAMNIGPSEEDCICGQAETYTKPDYFLKES
jgi:hypothetical protein